MSDEEQPPPPGDGLVAGRFRVLGLLGSGATASVYEALDTVDGGRVAVKVLHPHLAERPALREAFVREATTVAGVQHPALCAVIGSGADDEGATWTAWQLAPGHTLGEHVRERGVLSALSAVDVGSRVLDGLAALHGMGLVHRDISPSNIVVDVDAAGRVRDARIIDFGLVDVAGSTTRGGDVLRSEEGDGVVGNASYASPEQLRGERIGAAGDLYQVAGVLYFALTGTPPYARDSVEQTVAAHLTALPPTASLAVRGVPVTLDRAIVRGLLKDPAARFASAGEMREALQAIGASRSRSVVVAATVGPPLEPSTRALPAADLEDATPAPPAEPPRASPWLWVIAAAAVALVIAVVAVTIRPSPTVVEAADPSTAPSVAPAEPSAIPSATPIVSEPAPAVTPQEEVIVPPLEGLNAQEAADALAARRLRVGAVAENDGPRQGGIVLSANPSAESRLAPGSTVDLVISSGMQPVPAVSGVIERDAVALVTAAGFVPAVSRQPHSGVVGSVFDVQPGSGTRHPVGSTVSLLVVAPAPSASVEPTLAPSPTPTAVPTP